MIASNIFKWIGSLFSDFLFLPYEWLRLKLALSDLGWWKANTVNWIFLIILLVLFAYWMKQCRTFLAEGTEDKA